MPEINKIELIKEIGNSLSLALPGNISNDQLQLQVIDYINQLIRDDFHKLITLLYRIDISEQKLKQLLQEHPDEDAAQIIAVLIIERQSQKVRTRQQFNQQDDNITEEEKW